MLATLDGAKIVAQHGGRPAWRKRNERLFPYDQKEVTTYEIPNTSRLLVKNGEK